MVDLVSAHERIALELREAIEGVVRSSVFIQGGEVERFGRRLCEYTSSCYATLVGSGTAALQVAIMSLGIERGAEIITPSFSFIAAAEAIALLGYRPVLVDVDRETMLISVSGVRAAITERTRAIVPVHLFGQCAPMEEILSIAREHNLYVIEDACQAIGAEYRFRDGVVRQAGTMGDLGCISFFPSKNLGCLGDGGAILTQDESLYKRTWLIANHGAYTKYAHEVVGINSRLDAIQAAVLNVKLGHLGEYMASRRVVAEFYDASLRGVEGIWLPECAGWTSHVYHQYTIRCERGLRDSLRGELKRAGIPTMVYYPTPIHLQPAMRPYASGVRLAHSEYLAEHVLSLPIHTEMDEEQLEYITDCIKKIIRDGKS